jgi:hypothetical protein
VLGRDAIFFGEIHGTNEIPAFVGDVVCMVSISEPTLVLLELPVTYNTTIDRFLVTPNESEAILLLKKAGFGRELDGDGRESIAMFRLLDRLRRLSLSGRSIRVRAIDPYVATSSSPFTRDQQMAQEIRRVMMENSGYFAVALMGDIHVRRGPITIDGGVIKPTGMYLDQARFFSFAKADIEGKSWSCFAEGCGVQAIGGERIAPTFGVRMFGEIRSGFDGVFSVGKNYTASVPFGRFAD